MALPGTALMSSPCRAGNSHASRQHEGQGGAVVVDGHGSQAQLREGQVACHEHSCLAGPPLADQDQAGQTQPQEGSPLDQAFPGPAAPGLAVHLRWHLDVVCFSLLLDPGMRALCTRLLCWLHWRCSEQPEAWG